MNKITVFQGNSNTVTCTITGIADLIGYTSTLTVKADARDVNNLIEVNSVDITGLVITFDTTAQDNTQEAGSYIYEVNITDGNKVYTVTQDTYEIIESVKY